MAYSKMKNMTVLTNDILDKIKAQNNTLADDYCGIRGSQLHNYKKGSLYFKQRMDEESSDSAATELGTKLHMYLLENDKFKDTYTLADFQIPKNEQQKKFCNNYIKEYQLNDYLSLESDESQLYISAYKKSYSTKNMSNNAIEKTAKGLYVQLKNYIDFIKRGNSDDNLITKSDMSYIETASYKANKHPLASHLLRGQDNTENIFTANELTIFWKYNVLGGELVQRSTLDRLVIDFENKIITLIDVKTSKYAYEFSDRFIDYEYHIQMAFYWSAIQYLFRTILTDYNYTEFKRETRIIVFQTPDYVYKLPITCKVAKIADSLISNGYLKVMDYMDDIAYNMEIDDWEYNKFHYDNNGIDMIIE